MLPFHLRFVRAILRNVIRRTNDRQQLANHLGEIISIYDEYEALSYGRDGWIERYEKGRDISPRYGFFELLKSFFKDMWNEEYIGGRVNHIVEEEE